MPSKCAPSLRTAMASEAIAGGLPRAIRDERRALAGSSANRALLHLLDVRLEALDLGDADAQTPLGGAEARNAAAVSFGLPGARAGALGARARTGTPTLKTHPWPLMIQTARANSSHIATEAPAPWPERDVPNLARARLSSATRSRQPETSCTVSQRKHPMQPARGFNARRRNKKKRVCRATADRKAGGHRSWFRVTPVATRWAGSQTVALSRDGLLREIPKRRHSDSLQKGLSCLCTPCVCATASSYTDVAPASGNGKCSGHWSARACDDWDYRAAPLAASGTLLTTARAQNIIQAVDELNRRTARRAQGRGRPTGARDGACTQAERHPSSGGGGARRGE